MRFEPKDFTVQKDDGDYLSRIQISPHPAGISFLFIFSITLISLIVDVWTLPIFLRGVYYGLIFSRLLLLLWCLLALFTYLAGRIELTSKQIQCWNLPLSRFRPICLELSNIQKVQIRYGAFGKSFGYGTLLFLQKDASKIRLFFIKNPEHVKKHLDLLLK